MVKFPRTRIGKACTQNISLKNDGSIPATAKFELLPSDTFKFLSPNSLSLTPKSYGIFTIEFKPLVPGQKVWDITAVTLLNQFELMRFRVEGDAYNE